MKNTEDKIMSVKIIVITVIVAIAAIIFIAFFAMYQTDSLGPIDLKAANNVFIGAFEKLFKR